MVKIPRSKKLYSGDDPFEYGESDYDPSKGDPLRKQRKMDFIGGEMDELASTGYRGGSTAGGPLSNPTQYGPKGDKGAVPFEGQQRQMLSPQRAVEEGIESAIDAEISNLEKAVKSGDVVGEMKATGEIGRLQKALSKELKVSKAAQESMGDTYETAALRKRVTSAYGGKVDPGNVEYMIEDAQPLSTTKKGKGPGIKSAQAIIDTGLEAKNIPTEKLKDGEYSRSPSSMRQASVERALREGAAEGSPKGFNYNYPYKSGAEYKNLIEKRTKPYDFRDPMFGETGGILGKASKDPGGPTFTGVDKQGNILQPKPAVRFNAGKKVSGNKVGSVTPDAPKAVVSNEGFSMKKAFDDGVAQGMTSRQAQKNAERLQRLSKIKGKGKGKGKLFTTAAAIGIGSILNKDR